MCIMLNFIRLNIFLFFSARHCASRPMLLARCLLVCHFVWLSRLYILYLYRNGKTYPQTFSPSSFCTRNFIVEKFDRGRRMQMGV